MKKNCIAIVASASLASLLAIVTIAASSLLGQDFSPALDGLGQSYQLSLDNNTVFESGSSPSSASNGQISTTLGNQITFDYSGLSALASGFQTIGVGGYLKNSTALSGLSSLDVALAEGSASLTLSYGWSSSGYEVINQAITTSGTYSFDGSSPTYFRLDNSSTTESALLSSLSINYSCAKTTSPYLIDGMSFTRDASEVTLTGFSGSKTSVVVPSAIGSAAVTTIVSEAFKDKTELLTAYVPSSISTIGDNAFTGCTSLTLFTDSLETPSTWSSSWNGSSREVRYLTHDSDVIKTGAITPNDYSFFAFKKNGGSSSFDLENNGASTFEVIDSGIVGESLHMVSGGNYGGGNLINPSFTWTSGAKYRIEFDYRLASLGDTVYFQLRSNTAGDVYKQFGSSSELNSLIHFSEYYTLGSATDYKAMIFTGSASASTDLLLDNVRITRVDETKTVSTFARVDDVVKETMDDESYVMNIDLSPTSATSYIGARNNSISGNSLFLVSDGSYNGFYLTLAGKWVAGTYSFSCSYRVISLSLALYFKVYASSTVDTNMSPNTDGAVHTFSYSFAHTTSDNVVLQMFPDQAANVVIDDMTVTRTA